MQSKLTLVALACGSLLLQGCLSSGSSSRSNAPAAPETVDLSQFDQASAGYCDHTVNTHCLYPFPSNFFTREDVSTETGLRVSFDVAGMPVAQPVSIAPSQLAPQGVTTTVAAPVDPQEWNRNDGFSPGSMLLAHLPGIDLTQTGAVGIGDIEDALDADAPILVINADTGERHLIWAELDANAPDANRQALIIRPAVNFKEGQRYIAAIRSGRNADGELLEPNELFRAYRDGIDTGVAVYEDRRAAMENIFDDLQAVGVARDNLNLAWDFTIASQESITARMLRIRDDAFARLGNSAPVFTVDQVGPLIDGSARDGLSRGITGTFEVPNYLNVQGGPPGSSFNYASDDPDALPSVLNGSDVFTARYRCQVPVTAVADFADSNSPVTPARAALYGHGLFGEGPGGEFRAGNVRAMQTEHNVMFCATDWVGMATEDFIAGVIHRILANISLLPQQLDRSQQGLLNAMFLAELLKHPQGFQAAPAFRHGPADTLVYDPSEVFYDGNSQGGILGGALVATAPNIDRGVLGVPGSNYSLLLRRYGPFNQRFGSVLYEAYEDGLDRSLTFALMQMLWDRAENNGYLSHLAGDYLPNTGTDKRVLLHVGLGDYQVTQWSAEIMARTIGAAIHEPTVRLGEHPDSNPYHAIRLIEQYPYDGHALMIWDSGAVSADGTRGNPFPPTNNTGPDGSVGNDPHESPRNTVAARLQKSEFMKSGGAVVDVCGAGPCYSDDYTGIAREP